jgi:hypothetical protein
MTGLLSLGDTAARVSLSKDRLRKSWRSLHFHLAFPAPSMRPPQGRYGWDPDLVEAWIKGRSQVGGRLMPPANDTHPLDRPGAVAPERLASQRRQLAAFMKGT